MLFEMRFSNFYSIRDEVSIDFRAGHMNTAASRGLSGNVFSRNDDSVLKVLGMFGPNASGKTSVLKAASFCRHLVLDSHNYNAGTVFDFIPFKFDGCLERPSTFFIDFVTAGVEYEYSFTITRNGILSEELYYYPGKRRAKVFTRNEGPDRDKGDVYSFGEGLVPRAMDVARSTSCKTLFISRASQMDREIPKSIYSYFQNELLIGLPQLSGSDATSLFKRDKEMILFALRMADSDIADVEIQSPLVPVEDSNGRISESVDFCTRHRRNPDVKFNLAGEESAGTIQVFRLLLVLLDVCRSGKTLLLDEFDSSLHTQMASFILDLVNASESAQLLFASHNTNLLDMKRMRRDQILFTNKTEEGATEVYSLYDFKDFRENMDAEKCYLQGRFDAVPYINSSPDAIRELLRNIK